jgi:hypothetical protein
MNCKFFTIVKSYFYCCANKDNEAHKKTDGDGDNDNIYRVDSPFTFNDLTYSGSSSAWSSSSSLDGYDEKHKQQLKESVRRMKKYQRNLFLPYEEDNDDS